MKKLSFATKQRIAKFLDEFCDITNDRYSWDNPMQIDDLIAACIKLLIDESIFSFYEIRHQLFKKQLVILNVEIVEEYYDYGKIFKED